MGFESLANEACTCVREPSHARERERLCVCAMYSYKHMTEYKYKTKTKNKKKREVASRQSSLLSRSSHSGQLNDR